MMISGFAPLVTRDPHILLLGSMPGVKSLEQAQYYGHPRNAFWPITGALFGFDPALPYAGRVAALADAGVAVWDVLASCTRPGSLDSAIDRDSMAINDFATFLAAYPRLRTIGFNGNLAATLFRKLVLPSLPHPPSAALVNLPSTSPAHAGLNVAAKLELWRKALNL